MKLVDLNVLLYAVNADAPQHDRINRWWVNAVNGDESLGLLWVVVLGFLRIATNPKIYPAPMSIDVARGKVDGWLATDTVFLVSEKPDHWQLLSELLADTGAAGNLTTDAHLAAAAITHGATLVSCDGDFARFPNLRWENPLQSA
ncbi:MAG: type II toxin-antitoxin system VapC family toxin [Gammaproteobacteria bacterium]|nr:type II toxin-antitoxin system VapC family toxin [Gammaproteobacteria bacterium]